MAKRSANAAGDAGPTPDDSEWPWLMLRNALDLLPVDCHNAAAQFADGSEAIASDPERAKVRLGSVIRWCDAALEALPGLAAELDARLSSASHRWTVSVHVLLGRVRQAAESASIAPDCPGANRGAIDELRAAVPLFEQFSRELHAALRLPPVSRVEPSRASDPRALFQDRRAQMDAQHREWRAEEAHYRHIPYEIADWVAIQTGEAALRSQFREQTLAYLVRWARYSAERAQWKTDCEELVKAAASDATLTDEARPPGQGYSWQVAPPARKGEHALGAWISAPPQPNSPDRTLAGVLSLDYSYAILTAAHDAHVCGGHSELSIGPLIEDEDFRGDLLQSARALSHWRGDPVGLRTRIVKHHSRRAVAIELESAKRMVEADLKRTGIGGSDRAPGSQARVPDLLGLLESSREGRLPVAALSPDLDWEDALRVALADGLVVLERRNHCWVGGELRMEDIWDRQWGAGGAPVDRIIAETGAPDADPRIACHARITEEGKARLARERIAQLPEPAPVASAVKSDNAIGPAAPHGPAVQVDGLLVCFAGEKLLVSTRRHAELVSAIFAAGGDWRTSGQLATVKGERIDRLYKQLPEAVRASIESRRGTGYRWIGPR